MNIIERLKEMRAKELDAPKLLSWTIAENATKNAAYNALPALLEIAEAAEEDERNHDCSPRMLAAIAKLRETKL